MRVRLCVCECVCVSRYVETIIRSGEHWGQYQESCLKYFLLKQASRQARHMGPLHTHRRMTRWVRWRPSGQIRTVAGKGAEETLCVVLAAVSSTLLASVQPGLFETVHDSGPWNFDIGPGGCGMETGEGQALVSIRHQGLLWPARNARGTSPKSDEPFRCLARKRKGTTHPVARAWVWEKQTEAGQGWEPPASTIISR